MSIYLQDREFLVCIYQHTRFESESLNKFSRDCCRMSIDISRHPTTHGGFVPPLLTWNIFFWGGHSAPQSVVCHGVRCAIDLCCLVQRLPAMTANRGEKCLDFCMKWWHMLTSWQALTHHLKTKISSEYWCLDDEISFKIVPFQGTCWFFWGVTSRDTSLPHKSWDWNVQVKIDLATQDPFKHCQLSGYPALHAPNETLKKDNWTQDSTLQQHPNISQPSILHPSHHHPPAIFNPKPSKGPHS